MPNILFISKHSANAYLARLANCYSKKAQWIRDDLTIQSSSVLGRIFFAIIKPFASLRRYFFHVDPEKTKQNLMALKSKISPADNDVYTDEYQTSFKTYKLAIEKFNDFFPKHKISQNFIDEIDSNIAKKHLYMGNMATLSKYQDIFHKFDVQISPCPPVLMSDPIGTFIVEKKTPFLFSNKDYKFSVVIGPKIITGELRKTKDGEYLCVTSEDTPYNKKVYHSISHFLAANAVFFETPKLPVAQPKPVADKPKPAPQPPKPEPKAKQKIPSKLIEVSKPEPQKQAEPEIVPFNPSMRKWVYCQDIMKRLAAGENVNALLSKAFEDAEPEVASYLIKKKGASLAEVNIDKSKLTETHAEMLVWLENVSKEVELLPKNLDHFALELGYGYKTANLMMLEQKAADINKELKSATVKIPSFMGGSDFEMRHYIKTAIPEIETLWKDFLNTFDEEMKMEFIARDPHDPKIPPLKITEEGQKILTTIKTKIVKHFAENCYYTLQMDEWLKTEKPELIIVRSTGKEDTENNSNAGGNDSIPFIEPDPVTISFTIGRVLSSYFGEKSVGQRLLAGDKSLFTQDRPFLPVLLQTMVLESGQENDSAKNPLDIPRSGVLFTTQKDKANGVTFIQTGLGNNEGVVSSQVAVDSYFVDKAGRVHSVVRDKKTRFIRKKMDNGKYEAAHIDNNNPEMQRSQALPTGVVKDIKKVADALSYHYSPVEGELKALDMEYSVKLREANAKKPVIYLLQARPLNSCEAKVTPSYLDLSRLKHVAQEQQLRVNVLIDIHSSVRTIESANDVIFTDTLPQALEAYTKAPDPQKVKAIFVKKSAPSTSHESVVLRPKGVAVVYVNKAANYTAIEKMVTQSSQDKPILLDTQRGIIVDTAEVDEHSKLVTHGLISYPSPRELSIPMSPLFNKLYTAKGFDQFKSMAKFEIEQCEELYKGILVKSGLNISEELTEMTIAELFDMMAKGNEKDANSALSMLLFRLHEKLKLNMRKAEAFRAKFNMPLFNVFQFALQHCNKEVIPAFKTTNPQSMERLYPLKFLEAAIFQEFNPDIVGCHSYAIALLLDKAQKEGLAEAKKLGLNVTDTNLLEIIQFGKYSGLSESAIEHWNEFTKEAIKFDKDKYKQIADMLREINALGLNSLWMGMEFEKLWMSNGSTDKKASAVLNSLQKLFKENKKTFDWIKENEKRIPSDEQISHYAEPAFVQKEYPKLQNLFLNTFGFGDNAFKKRYEDSSTFGQLALLQFYGQAVNTYDSVIKQVTGSTAFPEDRKLQAKCFIMLLETYSTMMKSSLKMISAADEKKLMTPTMGSFCSFDDYVKKLMNGYGGIKGFNELAQLIKDGKTDVKQQFEARREFNVSALIIGSKNDLDFHVCWPNRAEEYFTTFHQNMEVVRSHLLTQTGLNPSMLGNQAKNICEEISGRFKSNLRFEALEKGSKNIQVVFPIPLRQHAGSISVKYDPNNPGYGVDITFRMAGNHEHSRWYQGAFVGAWLGNLPGLSFTNGVIPHISWSEPYAKVQAVEFSLHIDPSYKNTKELIAKLHFAMCRMTMNGHSIDVVVKELNALGDLKQLNPEFFSATAYGCAQMLEELRKAKNFEKLAPSVNQAIKGLLKHQPVHDLAGPIINEIKVCTKDLVQHAPTEIQPILKELLQNQQFKTKYPELYTYLQTESLSLLPPEQILDMAINDKDWGRAIRVLEKYRNSAKRDQVIEELKKLTFEQIKGVYVDIGPEYQKKIFWQYLVKLDPQIMNSFLAHAKQVEARQDLINKYAVNLSKIFNELPSTTTALIDAAADVLIAAVQRDDFETLDSDQPFTQFLSGYLNGANYKYIWDNNYPDTKKIRKGCPLLIIKAMEIKHPAALVATERLITDYLDYGKPDNKAHRCVVYALSKAYFENSMDKKAAAANLKKFWRNNAEHITNLSGSFQYRSAQLDYNINF